MAGSDRKSIQSTSPQCEADQWPARAIPTFVMMPLYVRPLHAHHRHKKCFRSPIYFFCSGPIFFPLLVTVQ